MKKYLIVCDTTSTFSIEEAKANNIELVPLSVILDGKEYKDCFEITKEELHKILLDKKMPTTSQPNTGYIETLMENWKEYDEIIIFCISGGLSGTVQSFNIAKNALEMNNVHIIDTKTVAAPLKDAALEARRMADAGKDIQEILAMIEKKFNNTHSIMYPATLEQLKRGGRISPLAASMASTLKLKPLLYLKDEGDTIDKYAIARTEKKLWSIVTDFFNDKGVNKEEHRFYIDHFANEEGAKQVKAMLEECFPGMECIITDLPAVLACHAGMGCIAVQSTLK